MNDQTLHRPYHSDLSLLKDAPPVSLPGTVRLYADVTAGALMISVNGGAYLPFPTGLTPGGPPSGPAGGDLAGTYPNPVLKAIVSAASIGSASKTVTLTVDTKGRVTAFADVNIQILQSQVTGLVAALATFLVAANNLSDLTSQSAARSNLGLGTAATQPTSAFDAAGAAAAAQAASLQIASNLSDLNNPISARSNLGLGTAAVQNVGTFLQVANNLSDILSQSTARSNLGLGTAAVVALTSLLQAANNLSDVTSPSTARSNLGLGTAAVLNTGTANGQVALSGLTINQQSGTTYTFVTADANKRVEGSNAGATTYTIDTNANQPMTIGDVIEVCQMGAGQITIAAAGGVTLDSPGGKVKTNVQYSTIGLVKQNTNTWVLSGDLA